MMLHLDKEKNAPLPRPGSSSQAKRKGGKQPPANEHQQQIAPVEWGPTLEKNGPHVLIVNDQEHLVSILLPQFAIPSTQFPSFVRKLYRW
jgi:hypothetical protein